jgi:hypothetical protein
MALHRERTNPRSFTTTNAASHNVLALIRNLQRCGARGGRVPENATTRATLVGLIAALGLPVRERPAPRTPPRQVS